MSILQKLNKGFGMLFELLDNVAEILIASMTILVVTQVFCRNVLNYGIRWCEEVCLIGMVWVTFFTLAVGVRHDIHMRIDLFVSWMPKRWKKGLELFTNCIILFAGSMMAYYGAFLFQHGFSSTLAATKFPTAVIYAPIPVVGTLCVIQMLLRIFGIAESKTAEEFINRGGED